jgi:hypothetical protein
MPVDIHFIIQLNMSLAKTTTITDSNEFLDELVQYFRDYLPVAAEIIDILVIEKARNGEISKQSMNMATIILTKLIPYDYSLVE